MNKLYAALALLSWITLVGTEGASKTGSISLGQAIVQGLIALVAWMGFTYLAVRKGEEI